MSWLSDLFGGGSGAKERRLQIIRDEQEAAQRAQQQAEQQRQEREAAARAAQQRQTFEQTARGFAPAKLKASGINDTYGISDYFNTLLNQRLAALPEGVDAASKLDLNALYDTAYGDVREGARRKASGQVNQAVGQDYGRTQFGDTVDDTILDSILATQRGSATEAIQRARSRGILNDAGLAAAERGLGERGVAGRSTLEDLGQGVLSRYRTALDTGAENLRQRAGTLDLTDNFDIAGAIANLGKQAEGFRGRMEGDIRSAATGLDVFDVGSLLGRSASEQGFTNPGSPVLAAFAADRANKAENDPSNRRLVRSTGAF